MVIKPRLVPDDLRIMRSLNTRMNLTEKERKYYLNREKGFKGEVMFDKLTEKLQSDCYIINDLLLEISNTEFQIDSSIIFQETLHIYDVKNYDGDYYYDSGRFYTNSGKLINNPLDQLKRSESLLRQYLQNLRCNIAVEGHVVFVNPDFTLYQAPRDKPLILPTQLNCLMEKLNGKHSKLSEKHLKLANQLISDHKIKSRNVSLPHYEYNQLKKGVTCAVCYSFSYSGGERKMICDDCGAEEDVADAVLRCVEELKLLFPEMQITTYLVNEWCKGVWSKKVIKRILKQNFRPMGTGRWSYYVNKDDC